MFCVLYNNDVMSNKMMIHMEMDYIVNLYFLIDQLSFPGIC